MLVSDDRIPCMLLHRPVCMFWQLDLTPSETALLEQPEKISASKLSRLVDAGELAKCCPAMEAEAVFLLCQHAASCLQHKQLVAAVLDTIASTLTYPGRSEYMEYHKASLVYAWIHQKNSLSALLTIQVSVAPCFLLHACPAVRLLAANISKGRRLQLLKVLSLSSCSINGHVPHVWRQTNQIRRAFCTRKRSHAIHPTTGSHCHDLPASLCTSNRLTVLLFLYVICKSFYRLPME